MNKGKQVRFMQGNEAVVEAGITAGVRFFAGYPITPASEIAELMSIRMPQVGGTYVQMEDELASMAAVIGASMGSVKAMTATSGPGFSLMQENLGYASMVEIPCVIVNVMRVGPASGMPTHPSQGDVMQSRWGTHGDHPVVVLSPSNVKEAFDLTIEAVNISEMVRVPVVLLSDAIVGHIRERVELPDPASVKLIERKRTSLPPSEYKPFAAGDDCAPEFADRGNGYRYHMCSNVHNEWGFPADSGHEIADRLMRRLHKKIEVFQDRVTYYKTFEVEDAEYMVVAYGCVARSAKDAVKALRSEGIKAGLLQLQTIWPFPAGIVRKFCAGAKKIIVPEMNMGQLINEVRLASGRDAAGVNRADGIAVSPKQIIEKVKAVK
ncbi:MAG: 2-oxoacid:acceptor oxidoreductase subunit alpha [Peptococcaceae bacterium]|jgi:2-oxoglutarate ferredoxin oxidoreductase subunit alpha|nr:2-oxoacid:acceptor oxidoreductase subunit alpha [Peptococcaceae bacterium]MDH7524648.1 2-oxoacid:acceptor oxidoreductase subunit alpha [Peptococcaceae bacterium]